VTLPLAANDPRGDWTVTVQDLLANSEDRVTFAFTPAAKCASLAGATHRAVYFGRDRKNVFRFFRVHETVTIVKGERDYNDAAAERIAEMLKPWDVRCRIVDAGEVNRPRTLTEEEAKTWIGLRYAGRGQIKPGDQNPTVLAGFALRGPAILLGTPEDNPLTAHLLKNEFLPYQPNPATLPGPRRGYLAWQRDGLGANQESITLIAYDAEGMSEAVGSLYEALAGLDPLTPWIVPKTHSVEAATKTRRTPGASIAWQAALPDRADAMRAAEGELTVLTHDGSLNIIDGSGEIVSQEVVSEMDETLAGLQVAEQKLTAETRQKHALGGRIVKKVAVRDGNEAVGYWGGYVRLIGPDGQVKMAHQFQHDLTGIVWFGEQLVVGLSDGRVVGLRVN